MSAISTIIDNTMNRAIHKDFLYLLQLKDDDLIQLYIALRNLILDIAPGCNELLYHTHALTSVYSTSDKLGDGFCHIPIYANHLNLGFNKGTLLDDPKGILQGTGKLIRHIPIKRMTDLKTTGLKDLIKNSIAFANDDMDKPSKYRTETFSKIKIKK